MHVGNSDLLYVKCLDPALCTPEGCATGTRGVLCQDCAFGYGKQFGKCVVCNATSVAVVSVGIVLGIVIVVLLLAHFRRQLSKKNAT